MRLLRLRLAIFALAALASCAHVDAERELLGSLRIEGNRSISSGRIEEKLALEESPVWPWAQASYFDEGTLIGDKRRVARFYRAEGFYEAEITSQVSREEGIVSVIFAVDEGPATTIRRLSLDGLDSVPDDLRARMLARPLPLREGARIREEDFDAAKAELEQRLRDFGYADAAVKGQVSVDPAARKADVRLVAEPGPRLRFGRVVITGAVQVPRETILARVREVVPEGKTFSDQRLAETQAALFDLGPFAAVRVSRGPADA
ncbi:MAG TPA: POTRA domain-containing protein, partial [Vulgatibacter sp.]